MKYLLIIGLSFLTIWTYAQKNENEIQSELFYLALENGDSIQVKAKTLGSPCDTVYLLIEKISKGNRTPIQSIKSLYSYPLEISKCPSDFGIGFYIKYDPAVRNGNNFMYLFNQKENIFLEVVGFRDLGMIEYLNIDGKKYFYSYASCGCTDACWKSIMFKIHDYKIDTLAYLSCDCTRLIEKETDMKEVISDSCEIYSNYDKFEKIKIYWIEKIKNGL